HLALPLSLTLNTEERKGKLLQTEQSSVSSKGAEQRLHSEFFRQIWSLANMLASC
uniref:Uncharacterized protein n=1 Tax=Oryzias melastigma TaxID=30732 RepID=A0A3B3BUH4_ORYME